VIGRKTGFCLGVHPRPISNRIREIARKYPATHLRWPVPWSAVAERDRRHRFLDVDQRTPNPVAPLPPRRGRHCVLPPQSKVLVSAGELAGGFDLVGCWCVQSRLETGAPWRRAGEGDAQRNDFGVRRQVAALALDDMSSSPKARSCPRTPWSWSAWGCWLAVST